MSNLLSAVSLLTDLAQAAVRLSTSMQAVSATILKAQSEGRDLTPEEWAEITAADDKAKAELEEAIKAKGQ